MFDYKFLILENDHDLVIIDEVFDYYMKDIEIKVAELPKEYFITNMEKRLSKTTSLEDSIETFGNLTILYNANLHKETVLTDDYLEWVQTLFFKPTSLNTTRNIAIYHFIINAIINNKMPRLLNVVVYNTTLIGQMSFVKALNQLLSQYNTNIKELSTIYAFAIDFVNQEEFMQRYI